jgi:hypothetical protein
MITEHPTCNQPGTERSNPQGEAWEGEPVSRNALRELDSASLRKLEVVNLPKWAKPETDGEVMFTSNHQASRSGWRRRAGKERSWNLRDPLVASQPFGEVGQPHSSKEVANHHGAKGADYRSATIKRNVTA